MQNVKDIFFSINKVNCMPNGMNGIWLFIYGEFQIIKCTCNNKYFALVLATFFATTFKPNLLCTWYIKVGILQALLILMRGNVDSKLDKRVTKLKG